jgi:phage regulator Rha-like protein
MGLNILQKKQQLEELTAKLASIQQEVYELENKNPEFTLRIQELEKNKKLILKELETPLFVSIEGFAEISCLWEGVGEWPQIIDWKFVFDDEINKFIEKILINDRQIALLFETKHKKIKNLLQTLTKLDEKVTNHNERVKEIYEESQDEAILTLSISNCID